MIILTPAYGRDYTSKAKVLEDFNANRDFIYNCIGLPSDGKPCNKSSLQQEGVNIVNIRYKKLRSVMVHKF